MYGNLIYKIRKSKNMNLRDFGALVDISHNHLSLLEREKSNKGKSKLKVPIDSLKQICDRTGYPFRQFLEEAGYIEPVEHTAVPSQPHALVTIYEQLPPFQRDSLMLIARGLLTNSYSDNILSELTSNVPFSLDKN